MKQYSKWLFIALLMGISVFLLSTGNVVANVSAPPVNQEIGMPDVTFGVLIEADCRACHEDIGTPGSIDETVPNRHHLLMNSAISTGKCSTFNGTCSSTDRACEEDFDCPATETCDAGDGRDCITDADCETTGRDICNITGAVCTDTCENDGETTCAIDDDCVAVGGGCKTSSCGGRSGQYCGQPLCMSGSAAQDSDANNDGNQDTDYACLNCHTVVIDGGIIEMVVYRDCAECHVKGLDQPTVHHNTPDAKGGLCATCHGDIVDNLPGCKGTCTGGGAFCESDDICGEGETCVVTDSCDDGHVIPTYEPSLVTPQAHKMEHECKADPSVTPGECSNDPETPCVDAGDCTGYGVSCVLTAIEPQVLCNAGQNDCAAGEVCGYSSPEVQVAGGCAFCHNEGTDSASSIEAIDNHDTHHGTGIYKNELGGTDSPRMCVWCHRDGDAHPSDMSVTIRACENCHGYESLHNIQGDDGGGIDVGGMDAGYGHIGNNDDCWGCHGFAQADAAPGTGEIAPTISSSDVLVATAGTDTVVNLTGMAFTNTYLGMFDWTSVVRLTASDGSTTILTPDSISESSITVTIPGTVAAGNYDVAALKGSTASNTVVISVKPAVVITDSTCNKKKGVLSVSGSGFGEKPVGSDYYINVQVDGQSVDITSWSDTQITASVSKCSKNATITVDAVMGSDTSGSSGGGKPDKPCKGKKCN